MNSLSYYLRPPIRTGARFWGAVCAAGLLSALLCYQALQMRGAGAVAEQQVARLNAARASLRAPIRGSVDLTEQKRWAALQQERDFSWGDLFAAVEKASSADIELLAFEPDKGNRTVQLKGEARDQKALLTFLETLAKQRALKNVHLTHQQRKKRERLETLVFEIKAGISG